MAAIISVSKDGGQSFTNESVLSAYDPSFANVNLQAAPGLEGVVWVSLGSGGLWGSSNYGKSFTQVSQVEWALLFAFGKEAPGSSVPAVYVLGTIGSVQSVFVSNDLGASWEGIFYYFIIDSILSLITLDIGSEDYGLGDNPWSMII